MNSSAGPFQPRFYAAVSGTVICYILLFLYLKPVAGVLGVAILAAALIARFMPDSLTLSPGRTGYLTVSLLFFLTLIVATAASDGADAALRYGVKQSYFLIGAAVMYLFSERREIVRLLYVFAIATASLAGVTLFQYVVLGIHHRPPTVMLTIQAGYIMVYGLIITFLLLMHGQPSSLVRRLLQGGIGLTAVAIYLNGSLGAWLSVAVVAVCYVLFLWPVGSRMGKVALVILLLALVAALPAVRERLGGVVRQYAQLTSGGEMRSSTGQRILLWQASWEMFRSSPLLGVGPTRWQECNRALATDPRILQAIGGCNQPHNTYFYVLSTTGGVGLAVFLAFALMPVRLALSAGSRDRMFGGALLLLSIAFLVQGGAETVPTMYRAMQAYLLLMGLAVAGLASGSAASAGETHPQGDGNSCVS